MVLVARHLEQGRACPGRTRRRARLSPAAGPGHGCRPTAPRAFGADRRDGGAGEGSLSHESARGDAARQPLRTRDRSTPNLGRPDQPQSRPHRHLSALQTSSLAVPAPARKSSGPRLQGRRPAPTAALPNLRLLRYGHHPRIDALTAGAICQRSSGTSDVRLIAFRPTSNSPPPTFVIANFFLLGCREL